MKWISVRMKRRISKTKMLKRKQIWYQQSIRRKQLKSIIYKKNELSIWLSDGLQGAMWWLLNQKWVTLRQYGWKANVDLRDGPLR